jgi:hypothetical protein
MMKRFAIAAAAVWLSTVTLPAQAPEIPKPGPEHQKLAPFVGNWTFEGEMKPGPMGPGGKVTGTDQINWVPGNFFIQRLFTFKLPVGTIQGLEIIGYDAGKKQYTFNSFDSMGGTGTGTVNPSGSTWSAAGTMRMGPQTMHERCKLAFGAGDTTLAISCEMSMDGKKWAPSMEGKATKAK